MRDAEIVIAEQDREIRILNAEVTELQKLFVTLLRDFDFTVARHRTDRDPRLLVQKLELVLRNAKSVKIR